MAAGSAVTDDHVKDVNGKQSLEHESCRKSCTPTGFWGEGVGKVVRLAQSCVRKTPFKKMRQASAGDSYAAENACEATSINLGFGFGIGCRSSRRLQLARHAHNKCIASGQQKTLCGPRLVRMRRRGKDQCTRPTTQRICATQQQLLSAACRDYSAQPQRGKQQPTLLQCNSDNNT